MDVIARTVFGLQINSQVEANSPFVLHAKRAFQSLKTPNPAIALGSRFISVNSQICFCSQYENTEYKTKKI